MDFDPKALQATTEQIELLYSKNFLENFFSLYEKNWKQILPKTHSAPLTETTLEIFLEQTSILSELGNREEFFRLTTSENSKYLEEALQDCLTRLAIQESTLEDLENALALELSQLEEEVRDTFSEQRDAWEKEWLGTERSGEAWNDFEAWVESQVQKSPEILAAKQKLQDLSSDRKALNSLIHSQQEPSSELFESLYEIIEGLKEIEGEWLQQQWKEKLISLQDLNHQEYDELLNSAETQLDQLDFGEFSREQWRHLSLQMDFLETFYIIKDLAPGNYFVLSLQERLESFQKQQKFSEDQVQDLRFRLEINHSYAVARHLNPQHPKTLALREAVLGLEEWQSPPQNLLDETQALSQETLLIALLTSRIQHWNQLEITNLQLDALKDGLGLWGKEAERYQEVRKISGQYSHALSLIENGHFSQARELYLALEQNPRIAQWQSKTRIESFLGPLILEAIGVSGAALSGEILSHSVSSSLIARRLHPTVRGINLLWATKRIFQEGRLIKKILGESRALTRVFYASNTLGFTLGYLYFQQGFQDKPYWDTQIGWQENTSELGKNLTLNALMFSFLRNTMKIHQSLQVKKLLPTAAKNLEARLGTQSFRRLSKDEFSAGLQAELELLSHTLGYRLGAFSWELGGFTAFEPIALNVEKNWHRAIQGKTLEWENSGDFLWNPNSWAHRISFLLALKSGAILTHPFPKRLPDPAMEIHEQRLATQEAKLKTLLHSETPEPHDLKAAILQVYEARIHLLEALEHPNIEQRNHLNWVRQQKQEIENQWQQESGLERLRNDSTWVGIEHRSYDPSQEKVIFEIISEHFSPEQVEIRNKVFKLEIYNPLSETYESLFLFPQVSDPGSIAANTANFNQGLRQVVNGPIPDLIQSKPQILSPVDAPNTTPEIQASSTNKDSPTSTIHHASPISPPSPIQSNVTPLRTSSPQGPLRLGPIPRIDLQGREVELLREYYTTGDKETLAVAADLFNAKGDPRGELIQLRLKLEELKQQNPRKNPVEIIQRIEQIEKSLQSELFSVLGDSAKNFEFTWEYGFIRSCTIKTPCPFKDIQRLFSHDAAQIALTELKLVHGNDWTVFEPLFLEKLFILPGMEKIRKLNLEETPLVDLNPLRHLYQLEEVNLRRVPVNDLTPLAKLPQLKVVDLSRPNYDLRVEGAPDAPTDLSPLANLRGLEKLSLEGRWIDSLHALQKCKNLKTLQLRGVNADDFNLSPLREMTSLEFLDLKSTQELDVELASLNTLPLLPGLKQLDLSQTHIEDLTPLERCPNLHILDISSTPVRDLTPLEKLRVLQSLDMGFTMVQDVDILANLLNLRFINVTDSPASYPYYLQVLKARAHLKIIGETPPSSHW